MNNIHSLLGFFLVQYGDLATQKEQYSLSRRWGEYCISSVASSSYWLKKKQQSLFYYKIQRNIQISNSVFSSEDFILKLKQTNWLTQCFIGRSILSPMKRK